MSKLSRDEPNHPPVLPPDDRGKPHPSASSDGLDWMNGRPGLDSHSANGKKGEHINFAKHEMLPSISTRH